MELKDYYAILGVQPTDDLKTIKTAYRRLARKYHPDVSKENDAEAKFKDLAEAWEVLKDEQRRAEYDQLWQHRNDPGFGRQQQTHEQSYSQQDFDDIFSSMFGQQAHQRRRQHAARGHDLEIEVAVFLEETLAEQTRTISYNLPVYNVFGMIESETPKTLNVKIPAGVAEPGDRPAAGAMGGRAGRESHGAHPEREHSADGAAGQSGRAATAYQRERTREQNPHRRFVRRY